MQKNSIRSVAVTGMIAAVYVILTFLSSAVGMSSGVIQFRLSEILMILPLFHVITRPSVLGLTIGCLIANLLSGCIVWDIVFGTLATFLGAVGTTLLKKMPAPLALLPPIFSNMLIVPLVLHYGYHMAGSYIFFVCTVGIGEVLVIEVGGNILYPILKKRLPALARKNIQNKP